MSGISLVCVTYTEILRLSNIGLNQVGLVGHVVAVESANLLWTTSV